MLARLLNQFFGHTMTNDKPNSPKPFEATLATYNDKWVIVHDDQLMGMAVTRDGAIDLAIRLTRNSITDHSDATEFILHGATADELSTGIHRMKNWLGR